ncbi:hypothetical protein QBC46DRAFT_359169 [Diplogelasinospora grovesii]|uniref:BTB domain-containing protein n=1 Tax=Diplogelasinospora grovesii TaxID=303347 RepID=A0AAN6MVT5_9PEZI|nr:hypothetical protein QBC46DRAFT_359169 [Diplogelasinospora grovesii]
MGSISFEDIISSKTFRFSIGMQKREFAMHSALVSAQCPALSRLVNGEFKEARDFHAELESVNEETFILFAQYAYTGDYNSEMSKGLLEGPRKEARSFIVEDSKMELTQASPELEDVMPVLEEAPAEPVQEWVSWSVSSKKKRCSKCKRPHEEDTTRRDKLWGEFKNACSSDLPPRMDWPVAKSCSGNVFLSHARLYVFADCYGISGLMDLSFYKLGKALVDIEVDSDKVADVVDVLQYCYDELTPPKLRSLLVLYAACKVETLWKSTKFRELLARQSELSTALIGAMIDRLD